ncbi:putative nucleotidyltransferase substrate binding domain-containing protein [Nocardioides cynanchi]|uniref:putative nucleotidyltransferase substrate binding domain-containing protein n=1 Tax=Nocardioides cynanchi TaxID=2558918 RepID=UPI00124705E1|nr:putative nucleotidyltransferase substrate binding domain-containing protein [Nocardioides cynanchi]
MQEYVDFLGKQSPYSHLDGEDLTRLARTIEVEFFAPGTTIVRADGPHLDHLYVVRTGLVHIVDRGHVVDELGPGDTFGHISVLTGLSPVLSVVAAAETLCYRIPDPREVLEHPERLVFAHYNAMVTRPRLTGRAAEAALRPVRDFMREPLWCEAGTAIRDVAQQMSRSGHSCALFTTPEGLGIMTDSDCRRRVATGEVSPEAPVREIATVPARGVGESTPVSGAFVEMVMHGVHHLVVLDPRGTAVGVTRVFDLSSAEIRDPLTIRSAIDQAGDLDALAEASAMLGPTAVELYDAGVPALRAGALVGAMVEAILMRCIGFEPAFDEGAGVEASWLVLGSLARAEPLPGSDVDTALVWTPRPGVPAEATADDMLAAAERVLTAVERCGLLRCPDGANATEPLFNRSSEAWLAAVRRRIDDPHARGALLLSAIVTDSRPVTGLALGRSVNDAIERQTKSRAFLDRMRAEALAVRPPSGFVRGFVVEANGRHRGQLDLKKRGIGPIVAIGRLLAIATGWPAAPTQDRLEHGAAAGLLTRDEADTLRGAHREMFELQFAREIGDLREGRDRSTYLDPQQLDTLTRRHLRESFRAIARVQARLEGEWSARLP